ncbi:hypothetical protein, partial [Klebsiella pneumoniae]|uniref:hypothetical protein n=1 Tax=Klebsiella pneumoniae TaxID=573 RepID=UPI00224616B4
FAAMLLIPAGAARLPDWTFEHVLDSMIKLVLYFCFHDDCLGMSFFNQLNQLLGMLDLRFNHK